jgi:hypothetical protein
VLHLAHEVMFITEHVRDLSNPPSSRWALEGDRWPPGRPILRSASADRRQADTALDL